MAQTSITVHVRATPSASKEKWVVVGEHDYEAYVREPAQNSLANKRLRQLVARHYAVPETAVQQSTGHQVRSKRFVVMVEV